MSLPEIREVRPSDIDDMEELTRKSWIEGQEGFLTEEEVQVARESSEFRKSEEDVLERKEKDNTFVLVAEVDDRVVGRVRMAWNGESEAFVGDDEVQLRSMYVHPEYWRRGVATALTEEAFERTPDRFSNFVVEVFEENSRAVGFYISLGFEVSSKSALGPEDIEILSESRPTLIMRK